MGKKIITVAIHKGGTGKTTVSLNLAFFATMKLGKKVAFVDLDVQGNGAFSLQKGVLDNTGFLTSSMLFNESLDSKLQPVQINEKLFLVPPDSQLNGVERYPFESAKLFKKHLKELAKDYDLVIVDTPPTMGFAMLCPLMASDYALSPIVPDEYSIRGAMSMYQKVKGIQKKENPGLEFLGILINRWNRSNPDQKKIVADLHKQLAKIVLKKEVAEKTAIAKANTSGVPVWVKPSGGAARTSAKEMVQALAQIFKKMEVK